MSAASFAGRHDARNPSMRIVLFAQDPPRYQGVLFTTAIEPRTEPPCDHPEGGWQAGLFGGEPVYCCTFCGKELQEPATCKTCGSNKHWRHDLRAGHGLGGKP